MARSLLALDLGTSLGWAMKTRTGAYVSATETLAKGGRYEGGGVRFLNFERLLDAVHKATPVDEVAFEEVRRHAGTTAAHVYGGLLGVLTAWCEKNEVPYSTRTVQQIKTFATGKGNASKTDVVSAVRGWENWRPTTDDEADAIALLHLVLSERGE